MSLYERPIIRRVIIKADAIMAMAGRGVFFLFIFIFFPPDYRALFSVNEEIVFILF